MNEILMYVLAAGVLLGGIDQLLGNKRGYGKCLEEGFMLMGPTALSMVGMLCLIPLISQVFRTFVVPIFTLTGADPSVLGGILAIDMGGYQLAKELANNPQVGSYAGVLIASTFGCTLVFTIPVGMEIVEEEDRGAFAKGILTGLAALPAGLLAGGLLCGLSFGEVIWQSMPVFVLSLFLGLGLKCAPRVMMKGFRVFARGMKLLITLGLILGALSYFLKRDLIPGLAPIEDALAVVASIGITMLGSLPLAEFLRRLMRKPFRKLGHHFGLNETSVSGLMIGMVSPIPQLTSMKDMDSLGKVANTAFAVSAASALAAHAGFTLSVEPDMVGAMLAAKIVGAATAVAAILLLERKRR